MRRGRMWHIIIVGVIVMFLFGFTVAADTVDDAAVGASVFICCYCRCCIIACCY